MKATEDYHFILFCEEDKQLIEEEKRKIESDESWYGVLSCEIAFVVVQERQTRNSCCL